jgi:hypothetical protein
MAGLPLDVSRKVSKHISRARLNDTDVWLQHANRPWHDRLTLTWTDAEHIPPYTIDFAKQDRQDIATKEYERHQCQRRHMTSP